MARPDWCTKLKPCDYDVGSAYCVHRECRQNLERKNKILRQIVESDRSVSADELIERYTKR